MPKIFRFRSFLAISVCVIFLTPHIQAANSPAVDLSKGFELAASKAIPSVVSVFTETVSWEKLPPFEFPFDDFFRQFGFPGFGNEGSRKGEKRKFKQLGMGSGVIVTSDGYILTNNHVVANADTISVAMSDMRRLKAKVIGKDPKTDLAVIKVNSNQLVPISHGNSESLRIGEIVLAVGCPMSPELAHTVTHGIISALGRSNVGLAEYEDFIQTDAAINPGNSGGALVNLSGQLIGINTAIISQTGGFQGIGFAVPSKMAFSVMDALIKTGHVTRGYLGVYVQEISESLAKALKLKSNQGALVADVTKGAPADEAGIKQGDVITGINGATIDSVPGFRNRIASTKPGTTITLTVNRAGKQLTLTAKLKELPSPPTLPGKRGKAQTESNRLGISVSPLTEADASRYGIPQSQKGVIVTEVKDGSPAALAGLTEGDLIQAVNNKPVLSVEDFADSLKKTKAGEMVLLKILRQGSTLFIAIEME